MRSGFHKELGTLQEDILKMGNLVHELIYKAVKSMVNKDVEMAREVIKADDIVDEMASRLEERCLSMIARQQPMAKDLRMIAGALHLAMDLERIADHAEGLANITIRLKDQAYIKPLIDIPRMGELAREMLKKALKAILRDDVANAWSLVEDEKVMDAIYKQIFRELLSIMMEDPRTITQATELLLAAGHLERIADHITNVGEMVLYIAEGRRVDLNKIARTS